MLLSWTRKSSRASLCLLTALLAVLPVTAAAQLTLAWQDNATNEEGFQIERRIGATGPFTPLAAVAANIDTYSDRTVMFGTTYCYRMRAFNTAGTSAYTKRACAVAPPPDTEAPTVRLTAPTEQATVSGPAVRLAARATDNVGVVGVRFLRDGRSLGPKDRTTPYVIAWKSTMVPNGPYILSARAHDAAGQATTAPEVAVTVNNPSLFSLLIAAYNFDEGSGTTVADVSDNGHTGTVVGATWTPHGHEGAALVFDGGTDRVRTGLTAHAPVRTYTMWTLRTGGGGSGRGRMFDKLTTGTEVELFKNDGTVYMYERIWSGRTGRWSIPRPSANVWHHVALVYDASSPSNNPQIYVDGVARPVTRLSTPAGTVVTNTNPYVIGNRSGGDQGWSGRIDEVRIYNRALSASEIQQVMATPVASFPTFPLRVTKGGTGSGTVRSMPIGMNCGTRCTTDFPVNTVVTLRATPDSGSTFSGWSGFGDCTDGAVTMRAAKTCTATFTLTPSAHGVALNGAAADAPLAGLRGSALAHSSASARADALLVAHSIGLFHTPTGTWRLDSNGNGVWEGCAVDRCVEAFGQPGNLPVVGDWLGTGQTSLGVFDAATAAWRLDSNGNGVWEGCAVDRCVEAFGQPGNLPVVGDWLGTGQTSLGVFDAATAAWRLDSNGNGVWEGCAVDRCVEAFGQPGNLPVVGDWLGTGQTSLGVFDAATAAWRLDSNGNGVWEGCAVDRCVEAFGQPGNLPVVGDWLGTGQTSLGVFDAATGLVVLDGNGSSMWGSCTAEACVGSLWPAGALPVSGQW